MKTLKSYSSTKIFTLVISIFCIIGTIIATWLVRKHEVERLKSIFSAACNDVTNAIQNELNQNIEKLIVLRGFFEGSQEVDRSEFEVFIKATENSKQNIHVLLWAPFVSKGQIDTLHKQAVQYGYSDYDVIEKNIKPRKLSNRLLPVLFEYPATGVFLGQDLFSIDNAITKAILKSVRTGNAVAADLRSNPDYNKRGWCVFLPLYKDYTKPKIFSNLKGVLCGVFYADEIANTALISLNPKGIDFSMADVSPSSTFNGSTMMYYHESRLSDIPAHVSPIFPRPELSIVRDIKICLRKYRLNFHPVAAFYNSNSSLESTAVLLSGTAISILIIFMVFSQASKTHLVEKLVLERTEDLRKNREKLAASAAFLTEIIDSFPHPILVIDSKYEVVKANNAAVKECRNIKCDLTCCAIMQCDTQECPHDKCMVKYVLETGKSLEKEAEKNIDGEVRAFKVVAAPFSPEGGKKAHQVVMSYIDITAEKKMNTRLLQSQKMEAIGQLAGGIAHDLNNVLQVINGYAEMAKAKLGSEPEVLKFVDQIHKSGQKAAELTKSILAFGRKQAMQFKVFDMGSLVEDFKNMLARIIPETISVEYNISEADVSEGKYIIEADANMIEQILMNLCVNARDAMLPEGGTLTIGLAAAELRDKEFLDVYELKAGKYVILSVSDTGKGIEQKILDRIFEPFFTTKPVGKGTGLGLATVFGIVKQHNGAIIPDSEVGTGTVFKVYLPYAEKEITEEVKSSFSTASRKKGKLILLAEDDDEVRGMNAMILKEGGYHVIKASNGQEAYDLYRQHVKDINLLVLDVMMPEMTGGDLYHKILQEGMNVPVLFLSGYAEDSTQIEILISEGAGFLKKPFSSKQLLEKIREVLLENYNARQRA